MKPQAPGFAALIAFAAMMAAAVAATASPVPTLREALLARPPASGVVLSVDAQNVTLPPGSAAPSAGARMPEIAQAYGRLVRSFGDVTAVAPATMTLLNDHPSTPDLAGSLTPSSAFTLLVGSLQPGQWQNLVTAGGLGLNDLPDPDQRALFRAVLPPGKVGLLRFEGGNLTSPFQAAPPTEEDLLRARIRLTQQLQFLLPSRDQNGSYRVGQAPLPPGKLGSYKLYQSGSPDPGPPTLDGLPVRLEAPNQPKRSQMNVDSPRFQVSVPLDGELSVRDLVERIATASHTALDVDSRFGALPLTILPPGGHASAGGLLKALALCVTGAYRVVGGTAVLTHDVEGYGTQVERITEAHTENAGRLATLLTQVRDRLGVAHSALDLPPDSTAPELSSAQLARARQMAAQGQNPEVAGALSQLTGQQQSLVEQMAKEDNDDADLREKLAARENPTGQNPTAQDHPGSDLHVDIDKAIRISIQPGVEVLLPSVDAPVDASQVLSAGFLFSSRSPALPSALSAAVTGPALRQWLESHPTRRAVLIAPATVHDLDETVSSMRGMRLNQLWLVVFSSGMPWQASSGISGQSLLHRAIEQCRGTGIQVLPVLDLLDWGAAAPASLLDRSILGEDSSLASARAATLRAPLESPFARVRTVTTRTPFLLVSPFDPAVAARLKQLASDVSKEAGIAGMVWRATAPPGYLEPPRYNRYLSRDDYPVPEDMGYTAAAREQFLRRFHVDPLDINPVPRPPVDVTLPLFQDRAAEDSLRARWLEFRRQADRVLLRSLLPPTAPGASPLPVLIEANGPAEWYGLWSNSRRDPPGKAVPFSGTVADEAAPAKAIAPVALPDLSGRPLAEPDLLPNDLRWMIDVQDWDGSVFDFDPVDYPGLQHATVLDPLISGRSAAVAASGP